MSSKRQSYRSSLRNQPRTLMPPSRPASLGEPPIAGKNLAQNTSPSSGYLTYHCTGPGFNKTYSAGCRKNRSLIRSNFGAMCERIEQIIELEYRIATHFLWIAERVGFVSVNPANDVLQHTFKANLILVRSAYELTLNGAYSNARPLMRQAYEGAMIAKICSIDPGTHVYDRWLDGEHILFTSDVLARITSPSTKEFKEFWHCLSTTTHATQACGQPDINNIPATNEAPLNFIFLHMLLEANYHLLCGHIITSSITNLQRNYFPNGNLSSDRQSLRTLFREGKAHWMSECARNFIRDFRSNWVLS